MTDTTYAVHTLESAPETAAEALRALKAAVGVIPNLAAAMAESPALLRGFLALRELYAGHLTNPPLDDFLKPHSWTR